MKQILILGAGLVARPAVRYLLEKGDVQVILADQAVEKAEAIIDGHANGRAVHLDVEDAKSLAGTSRQPTLRSASCRGPCTRASPRFAWPTGRTWSPPPMSRRRCRPLMPGPGKKVLSF
jgi:hypothetical protein